MYHKIGDRIMKCNTNCIKTCCFDGCLINLIIETYDIPRSEAIVKYNSIDYDITKVFKYWYSNYGPK